MGAPVNLKQTIMAIRYPEASELSLHRYPDARWGLQLAPPVTKPVTVTVAIRSSHPPVRVPATASPPLATSFTR
jgi:hypothetical protein